MLEIESLNMLSTRPNSDADKTTYFQVVLFYFFFFGTRRRSSSNEAAINSSSVNAVVSPLRIRNLIICPAVSRILYLNPCAATVLMAASSFWYSWIDVLRLVGSEAALKMGFFFFTLSYVPPIQTFSPI